MRKIAQVGVLCSLFNCQPDELIRHSKTVYTWRGVTYEVVGEKSRTAPASHYIQVPWGKRRWLFRELGSQSNIIKTLKDNYGS